MKSVCRQLLWSIASLALLLAGILVWSVVFFDPNDYRESIADHIEAQTGFELTLEGSLGLDFRFQQGTGLIADLAVEDAYLRKIADIQGVQHAHIRELTISLPAIQLFRLVRGERFEGVGRFSVTDLDLVPIVTGLGLDGQSFDGSNFRATTVQGKFQSGLLFFSITDLLIAGSTTEVSGDLNFTDLHQDIKIEFSLLSPSLNIDEIVPEQARDPLNAFEWLSLSPLLAAGLRAQGVLHIGTFQSGGLFFRNLNIPINSRGGVVVASPITADLYDGTMRIDTVAQVVGQELDFMTRQAFSEVAAGKIINDLGLTDILRGKVDLNAIVAFSGSEYVERARSARGIVTLEAKAGQIRGLDIVSLLDRLAEGDFSRGGDWLGENSHTALENVAATLRLENSKLVNDNLVFQAGGLEVVGQGNLSLETQLVDYHLSLELDQPEIVALLPPPFNSVGLVLPLRVTGRWDNPGIMIDMPALIQMQFQRAMGIENHLTPPSVDTQAKVLGEILGAELSVKLNQLAPGEVAQ